MERLRGVLTLVAWLAALSAGLALFHSMGAGPLEAPALHRPATWAAWAAQREPITAAVALLRLLALALAWYLVGVTLIGVLARLLRAARLVRVADAVTIPPVRRFVQGTLGIGLATAVAAAALPTTLPRTILDEEQAVAARSELRDVPQATLRSLDERPSPAGDGPSLPHLHRHGPAHPPDPAATETLRPVTDAATLRSLTEEDPVHVVRSGESFWSIAQDILAHAWGREPTDAEVLEYWHPLIEVNRSELADPDNPDLLFPDQRLRLPSVPALPDGGDRG